MPFKQSTQFERAEVHIPYPIVNFLQPDIFSGTGDRHIDPALVPANTPVIAHVTDFESVRVFERRQSARHLTCRRYVERCRSSHVERFMRTLVIELLLEAIE